MAHYAKVRDGIVTRVIVAEPEFFDTFVDDTPGEWIKTSYNIRGGVYYNPETGEPVEDQSVINDDEGRQRKNFPAVGWHYDWQADAFYAPQPEKFFVLDTNTYLWWPPYDPPEDSGTDDENGNRIFYKWDPERHQELGEPHGWVREESQ